MENKEYKVNEVFRHTDGKVYQCVRSRDCEGCAFDEDTELCEQVFCGGGPISVKFIPVAAPTEGMLYRAESGNLYRLVHRKHYYNDCACKKEEDELMCEKLDKEVFVSSLGPGWCWVPVEEDAPAPAPVDPPKPPEPPRHLELGVVKVEGDKVTFKIVEQTHRRSEFSRQEVIHHFNAANGYKLVSCVFPEMSRFDDDTLFCRGDNRDRDDKEITCTAAEYARISEAVAEYNATDGRGCEKPWPQYGDTFFTLSGKGELIDLIYKDSEDNNHRKDFGNFFRTEEEAKAALERVKRALKGAGE